MAAHMTPDIGRELYGLTAAPPSAPARVGTARGHRCHACGSALIHREVPSGPIERWLLPLVGRRPYQCLDCGRRFWDRPRVARGLSGLRKGAAPRPLPIIRS